MLREVATWPTGDDVPWCSAFANHVARMLGLARSEDLRARSWLKVGTAVELFEAKAENDVVILRRGGNDAGPEVLDAPGHVGFFAGRQGPSVVLVLGGNQGDAVTIAPFHAADVLGVRRLA